ncbi:MAG: hypothetical protein J7J92_04030 [Candidatus Aenigmarchaeota archaeon]|nr:hypothetical protein [Candidatus Aenigmarchaeota archaeon]
MLNYFISIGKKLKIRRDVSGASEEELENVSKGVADTHFNQKFKPYNQVEDSEYERIIKKLERDVGSQTRLITTILVHQKSLIEGGLENVAKEDVKEIYNTVTECVKKSFQRPEVIEHYAKDNILTKRIEEKLMKVFGEDCKNH